jgi:hypothetical protein
MTHREIECTLSALRREEAFWKRRAEKSMAIGNVEEAIRCDYAATAAGACIAHVIAAINTESTHQERRQPCTN